MRDVRARAPGRVNLIGEHTDYNDGFVLPCAIAYDTTVRAVRRADERVMIASAHEDARTNQYVEGMLAELRTASVPVPGLDLHIGGTLPLGAGLSSSASLEIAVGLAVLALAERQMDPLDLALLAQRAERQHVGTQCGIMDQFAVLFARAGSALFLDTRTLQYERLPVPPSVSIMICNTMVKHQLASGEYNVRREQCETAVSLLRRRYPGVAQLRDVTQEQLERARDLLPPVIYNRALHVVSENERVLAAREALRGHDVRAFGELMSASHESLRTLYEVSSAELDVLVEIAGDLPGVYGARMTGGGFGGCTVNLVDASHAREFRERIAAAYEKRTGIRPELYDGTPSAGASLLDE